MRQTTFSDTLFVITYTRQETFIHRFSNFKPSQSHSYFLKIFWPKLLFRKKCFLGISKFTHQWIVVLNRSLMRNVWEVEINWSITVFLSISPFSSTSKIYFEMIGKKFIGLWIYSLTRSFLFSVSSPFPGLWQI